MARRNASQRSSDDRPAAQNDVVAFAASLLNLPPPAYVAVETLSPMARAFYAENRRVANGKARRLLGWAPAYPDYRTGLRALKAMTSPIPASSGRIIRHRLNRGGDRHLNRTLHDILLTRWRTCQRTRAHIARRRAEGKTDPEICRCLKRYIARELYRSLNTAMAA